jgi:DNA-directed RNA polymerase alpha subunit
MIVESLTRAGVNTIGAAAAATNDELDAIPNIGEAKVRRIKDVVYQAIWM